MLEIFEFLQILNTAEFVPVSVFIPMIVVIGCLLGLCLYFFVKYRINLHDKQRLETIQSATKRQRRETTVIRETEYAPMGTLLGTRCSGYDEIGTYANGQGGMIEKIIAQKSPQCGYGPDLYSRPPTSTLAPSHDLQYRRRASDERREREEQERRRKDSDNNDAMQFESQMSLSRAMALSQASTDATPTRRDTSCDRGSYASSSPSQDTTSYSSSDSGGSSDGGGSSGSCD